MGLMDLFGGKSKLHDCHLLLENVPGKFSGAPHLTPEGDFSVWFLPEDKKYLSNRNGVPNPNGLLELKVRLEPSRKQAFLDAASAMAGERVFIGGVMVNDEEHSSKALVQPLDLIYAQLPAAKFPVWFQEIVKNLPGPQVPIAFKVAAASDASKSARPPKADETRALKAFFPYPEKPQIPKIKMDFEMRKVVDLKTEFHLSPEAIRSRILMDLSVASAKQDGPGLFVGDFVAYWANE
jgi:hypothetical protein